MLPYTLPISLFNHTLANGVLTNLAVSLIADGADPREVRRAVQELFDAEPRTDAQRNELRTCLWRLIGV